MQTNTEKLFKKIFSILKPPPDLKLSEWADKYRQLSSEADAGELTKRRTSAR